MADVVTVDMEALQRCVRVLLVANVPGALWGAPGGGKTAVVEQIAASLKTPEPEGGSWRLFTLILSLLEQSDLSGTPYPDTMDGGRRIARYLPPACLPLQEIHGDIHSVLFLDEFDRAEPGLQNSSLQLLSQRQVHDKPLSNNCRILLAGNGTTDSLTFGLSEAACTRMCHLYIDNRADNTLRSWQRWATANDVHPAARAFTEYRWPLFHTEDEAAKYRENARLNRRTVTMASQVLADRVVWSAARDREVPGGGLQARGPRVLQ